MSAGLELGNPTALRASSENPDVYHLTVMTTQIDSAFWMSRLYVV